MTNATDDVIIAKYPGICQKTGHLFKAGMQIRKGLRGWEIAQDSYFVEMVPDELDNQYKAPLKEEETYNFDLSRSSTLQFRDVLTSDVMRNLLGMFTGEEADDIEDALDTCVAGSGPVGDDALLYPPCDQYITWCCEQAIRKFAVMRIGCDRRTRALLRLGFHTSGWCFLSELTLKAVAIRESYRQADKENAW